MSWDILRKTLKLPKIPKADAEEEPKEDRPREEKAKSRKKSFSVDGLMTTLDNMQKARARLSEPEVLQRRELSLREYHRRRAEAAAKAEEERRAKMHKSYMGARNSQYGTYWITNGVVNKKWRDSLGALPDGFAKGRTP